MKTSRIDYNKRKLQIIKAFVKSGLLKAIKRSISTQNDILKDSYKNKKQEKRLGQNLRIALEELGATFIKLGQMMSTRRDVFSKEVICELEKLQDNVYPASFCEVKEVIEEEFDDKLENIFFDFLKIPEASGSIAQAHKAYIKKDGEIIEVCIKVQRQNILKEINLDLKILDELFDKIEKYTDIEEYMDIKKILREFKNNLFFELDFNIEKNNLIRFDRYNKRDKYLHYPKVFEEYTTKKVLTMQYIDGVSIKNFDLLNYKPDKEQLANRLVYSYVNQFFRDGYFHADCHPGNIFVLENNHLALIDFGIVGKLSDNYRYQIMKMFMGITYDKTTIIVDAIIGMGLLKASEVNIKSFKGSLQQILDKYLDLSLHQMKLTDILTEFIELLKEYKIQIPSNLFNFVKTVIILEGVIESLVEDQSLVELAYPIAKKIHSRLFTMEMIKQRAFPKIYDVYSIIKELPESSLNILRQISDGSINFKIEKSKKDLIEERRIQNQKNFSIFFLSFIILLSSTLISLSILGYSSIFIIRILKFLLVFSIFIILLMCLSILFGFIRKD